MTRTDRALTWDGYSSASLLFQTPILIMYVFDGASLELITWTVLSPSLRPSFFDLPVSLSRVSVIELIRSVRSVPLINTREALPSARPVISNRFLPSKVTEVIEGRSLPSSS
jgi:hypothetical protein